MLRKILTTALILCASLMIFNAKGFAAEFEMVSYSAQVKLQWLANTGMPDAQKILQEIGTANIYGKKNLKDYDRLETVNGIYQELCYASTAEFVAKNNYKNILDIGGGYTPRAVVFARDGRKYIGGELTAVAMSAEKIMPKIFGAKVAENISYENMPVEDRDIMMSLADRLGSNICIIENGLMMYLTEERADAMFKNIKETLNTHGGCFITTDFSTREYFKDIATAVYGENSTQILYDETKDMYEKLFDSSINETFFMDSSKVAPFLAKYGLKAEQIPLITDTTKLYCTKKLSAEQVAKLNQIASKKYLWVIRN